MMKERKRTYTEEEVNELKKWFDSQSLPPTMQIGLRLVGTAGNTRNAIEFCQSHPVDIVITDIKMSQQTGLELIRILKGQFSKLNILVLMI